ncbi:MAG: hypothetical protein NNA21_02560 [Nitrospira sp.]|nr:hypothetical protein [Nitrospira sp.]MCP9473785.1 hypothetical protein [Nitrospira sp.]
MNGINRVGESVNTKARKKAIQPAGVSSSLLVIPRPLIRELMRLYDCPHPSKPGAVIRGYDRAHAMRTAMMCTAVAERLGHPADRLVDYQVACLLHDVSRAGLDRRLFGKIWSWANAHGVPTRPREWRAKYPSTPYGRETEAFVSRYGSELEAAGVPMTAWAKEQIEIRLGHARRLRRRLAIVKPALRRLGLRWAPWMSDVMLYYYYPEKLLNAKPWVKQLAEILVACEQLEAYSNRRRGRDYYARMRESFPEAFAYLDRLQTEGLISKPVMAALRELVAEGKFDAVLEQARGRRLTDAERRYLHGLASGSIS